MFPFIDFLLCHYGKTIKNSEFSPVINKSFKITNNSKIMSPDFFYTPLKDNAVFGALQ
jgi:hypothetical protein